MIALSGRLISEVRSSRPSSFPLPCRAVTKAASDSSEGAWAYPVALDAEALVATVEVAIPVVSATIRAWTLANITSMTMMILPIAISAA